MTALSLFFLCTSFISGIVNHLQEVSIYERASGIPLIDCIYVINLDERKERWEKCRKSFESFALRPNRISALNGWKIPLEEKEQLIRKGKSLLSGGEVGCLLSHLSVYRDALERGFAIVWICEDDIALQGEVQNLPKIIEELAKLDPAWDILYTDCTRLGERMFIKSPSYVAPHEVSPSLRRIHGRYGTHSIVFSSLGLQKALSYFLQQLFIAPLDVSIHYIPDFHEYSLKKAITKIERFPSDTRAPKEG